MNVEFQRFKLSMYSDTKPFKNRLVNRQIVYKILNPLKASLPGIINNIEMRANIFY